MAELCSVFARHYFTLLLLISAMTNSDHDLVGVHETEIDDIDI